MRDRLRTAMACAALLATTATSASAQTTFRETGSVTIGSYVVWVRGTNAGVVQLFVGRGFRDAFAQPHEMDAVKLQHWIDSVRALAPLPANDSSADDAYARASILATDVTMTRHVGGPFSGLRLLVTREDPITMAEPTARDFIAALDSAANVARELTTPPTPATPTVATIATVVAEPAAVAPAPVPAAQAAVPAPAPAPPVPSPSAPLGASTAQPAPELVLPAPAEPVVLLASLVEILPLPLPVLATPAAPPAPPAPVAAPPVVEAPPAPAPVAAPPVVEAPPAPAPVAAPPVVEAPPAPAPVAAPPVVEAMAPAPDSVVAPHVDIPADKLIHTPLGPFTIPGALLSDRDKEVRYCYTQLGLKYNPDLKGEITVKMSVSGDGTVQDAVVTKRSWQGISAGEVESCVRALAHDWSFAATDPTIADGSKLLTFSFAP